MPGTLTSTVATCFATANELSCTAAGVLSGTSRCDCRNPFWQPSDDRSV